VRSKPGVEPGAPGAEHGMLSRHERFASDEERRGIEIDRKAEAARVLKRSRHVRRFEEAVMNANAEESLAELFDLDASLGSDRRRLFDRDVSQKDTLVQHLVVLQIVQKRAGNRVAPRGEK